MPSITFLLPQCRQQVLGLLLLHPDKCYFVREIARLTNTAAGSLHRELAHLAKEQVIIRKEHGNQVYYQANEAFPIFEELVSILKKTSGIANVLVEALAIIRPRIEVAFIFGSIGRRTETAQSDVDILIIGEVDFAETVKALYPAQEIVRREINPKVYTRAEWKKLIESDSSFSKEILSTEKIFIIGSVNDIE